MYDEFGPSLTYPTPPQFVKHDWIVTRPDGLDGMAGFQFEMRASSSFMQEYCGRAKWPYQRKASEAVA